MGYDMNWMIVDDDELTATKEARSLAFAAARERDALQRGTPEWDAAQERCSALFDEVDALNVSYFRLNIFGMGVAREQLYHVGVMNAAEHAPWPKLEDFGLAEHPHRDGSHIEWDGVLQTWVDEETGAEVMPTAQELAFLEAQRDLVFGPPPGDTHGIPLYKVGSNDGWLVTPAEIKTGLAWADHHHEGWRADLDTYVLEFVHWMQLATEHEGFRVW